MSTEERMDSLRINSILITGCNRGIGLGLVKSFLEMPNPPQHVFATCRNSSAAQELRSLASKHPQLDIIQLELPDLENIKGVFSIVQEKLKGHGLNMLINNAGIAILNPLETCNEEDMINNYKINTIAPMVLTKEFIPLLKKAALENNHEKISCSKASVINISSILGSIQEVPDSMNLFTAIAYRNSKVALNMLTRYQAVAYKETGIMFIALHPGWVQTDMGGPQAVLSVNESVDYMMNTFAKLSEEENGMFVSFKGDKIPW